MMKAGAAESAPLLQKLDETYETPKPGAIAAAARQAKRGVGVFGVALALSGVLVAVMTAPDKTKKRAAASCRLTGRRGRTRRKILISTQATLLRVAADHDLRVGQWLLHKLLRALPLLWPLSRCVVGVLVAFVVRAGDPDP